MSELKWLPVIRVELEDLCRIHKVPLGVAVGWIDIESGGRFNLPPTKMGELGFWQLTPEECQDFKIDHMKLATDGHYSLAEGFIMLEGYQSIVRHMKIPQLVEGSEYWWRLTKLVHTIGAGAASIVAREAMAKRMATSWVSLSLFAKSREAEYKLKFDESMTHWFGLVDRVFDLGEPYGLELIPQATDAKWFAAVFDVVKSLFCGKV